MKNKISIILLSIIALSSCVIREPETPADFTKTGKQIFLHSENTIQIMMNLFNNALKIETYKNTPDSTKELTRQTYLDKYGVIFKKPNTWYLKRSVDTVFTVITDTKSIHSIGAKWQVKDSQKSKFIEIECVSANKWKVSATDTDFINWIVNSELIAICTEQSIPASYETSNFKIIGEGNLLSADSRQNVEIDFLIADSLVHSPNTPLFNKGIVNVNAKNIQTSVTAIATAEYIKNTTKYPFVKISYQSRSQIYENWMSATFYREDEYFGYYY